MTNSQHSPLSVHPLERAAFLVGAAGCLVVSVIAWIGVQTWQPMWPLPALYLIEIPTLSILAAIAFTLQRQFGLIFAWLVLGIIAAFSALGALSIGALYVPTAGLFAAGLISSHLRRGRPIAAYVGIGILGAVAQAGIMFAAIPLVTGAGAG